MAGAAKCATRVNLCLLCAYVVLGKEGSKEMAVHNRLHCVFMETSQFVLLG